MSGAVIEMPVALEWLHDTHMAKEKGRAPVAASNGGVVSPPMSDDDVLRLARAARNGAKFAALFDKGEGSQDASSNDAALLAMLAFYTQDAEQLDRLMRASALLRDKWDRPQAGSTYGALTIAKVLAMPGERFKGGAKDSRPFGGGRFEVSDAGVVYIGTDKDGGESPPVWLCSRLAVLAATRDTGGSEWGRLLEWRDDDGTPHRWAMPLELLQGDGADVRRELARQGVHITPGRKGRELLTAYLQAWRVDARARCVDRLGWHGAAYVTPRESIGEAPDEMVVFQQTSPLSSALSTAGAADDWRKTVAALAAGNSRLVFALSAAFAGPLAELAGEDSGGFHLRGGTSQGKSTALHLAASVWGSPKAYTRLWRATANGLEGLAVLHNDGLLILDEIGQCDPKEVGEAAYMLANGQGKARASRNGAARAAANWRVLFLSSGEVALSALMSQVGKRTNAGQEVRLADIDADAGAGMGAFENLHGHATPAGFALALRDATKAHGAVGIEWLRHLTQHRTGIAELLARELPRFVADAMPSTATAPTGAVFRVARRFALVAVAGEIASAAGLTGWAEGEASRAARACFTSWLAGFGADGNREDRALLAQVRAFFEAHGASRFQRWYDASDDAITVDEGSRVANRAGFYKVDEGGAREFYVLPEAFRREVCSGFDATTAVKVLVSRGWIRPGGDGRPTRKERLPGMGAAARAFVFTVAMWSDAT